jgi:hypothetical protein
MKSSAIAGQSSAEDTPRPVAATIGFHLKAESPLGKSFCNRSTTTLPPKPPFMAAPAKRKEIHEDRTSCLLCLGCRCCYQHVAGVIQLRPDVS